MLKNKNESNFCRPAGFAQLPWGSLSVKPVQEVIRSGLEELLRAVLEKEMDEFITKHQNDVGPGGLKEIVRNGYHKERVIQCSVGAVRVAVPRSKDRGRQRTKKLIFQSRIIPRYMRRVDELDSLIPTLYFKCLLSGDFSDIFSLLLGEPGDQLLPVSDVEELKAQWDTGEKPGWGYWNISNPNDHDRGYWNSGSPWWGGSGIWWSFDGSFNRSFSDWGSLGSGVCPANVYPGPWALPILRDRLTRYLRVNGKPQRNRNSRPGSITNNPNTDGKQPPRNNRQPCRGGIDLKKKPFIYCPATGIPNIGRKFTENHRRTGGE
ncbi:MAG: hypothetical protein GY940_32605 [bacterium]|nr:hypothetical protein [bacterium]